jgi:hypothetical protein
VPGQIPAAQRPQPHGDECGRRREHANEGPAVTSPPGTAGTRLNGERSRTPVRQIQERTDLAGEERRDQYRRGEERRSPGQVVQATATNEYPERGQPYDRRQQDQRLSAPPEATTPNSAARSDNAEQRRLPLLRLHAEASVFLMHQQLTSAVRTGPESLVLAKPLALRRLPPPATVSVNIDCGHRSAGVSEPSLGAAGP